MGKEELIKAVQKADNIISSCITCVQADNAQNYLDNFKIQYDNEEFYQKLLHKLNEKRKEINCDF